jgi:hypothetical protein
MHYFPGEFGNMAIKLNLRRAFGMSFLASSNDLEECWLTSLE